MKLFATVPLLFLLAVPTFGSGGKKKKATKKRALMQASSEIQDAISTSCRDETYSVSLYVDSHLFLTLEPDQSSSRDHPLCKETFVMHVEGSDKVVEIADEYDIKKEAMLPLANNMHLSELFDAFGKADSGMVVDDDYDIIHKNCATFVLNMMGELNIPVEDHIVVYAVEQLFENGETIQALKTSNNLGDLLENSDLTKDASDEQLIALLVGNYLQNHESA